MNRFAPRTRSVWACLMGATLAFAGCQSQQTVEPAPAPAPVKPAVSSGATAPAATPADGRSVVTMFFPTGEASTSAVRIEKMLPAQVQAGQPFDYDIVVTNLSKNALADVTVNEKYSDQFQVASAKPSWTTNQGGVASWSIPSINAGEKKVITVTASGAKPGLITNCANVTYTSTLCSAVRIVQPALQLVHSSPEEVLTCENLVVKYTVTNTGTGVARNVVITDKLDGCVTTEDGKDTVTLSAGDLAAGASREFTVNLKPTKTCEVQRTPTAGGAGGLTAKANTLATKITAPVLAVQCKAPKTEILGRTVSHCFTVSNTGDGVARGVVAELELPANATFVSATEGGKQVENKIVWEIGNLAPKTDGKQLCVQLRSTAIATVKSNVTVKGVCSKPASCTAQTNYIGLAAILLEVVDLNDPVEVGQTETYRIIVTNQGSSADTNVKIVCTLEDSMEFVSATGDTEVKFEGGQVIMAPVATLPAKGAGKNTVQWDVKVKAVKAGDVRFKTSMTSDQIGRPVEETEATNFYK